MNEPILIELTESDLERLEHYGQASYGSGGWQNLIRKLLKQRVEINVRIDYISRPDDLFNELERQKT